MDDTDHGTADPPTEAVAPDAAAQRDAASRLAAIAERLSAIDGRIAEFHRRAVHREGVIDRLNDENRELRAGARRDILAPVVTDLLALYDSLCGEAQRLAAVDQRVGKMLFSYADDVEQTLDRCGFGVFTAEPGEAYQPGRHAPVGTSPTDDPSRHNTVAEVVSPGLCEWGTDRVRRPVRARFWQYRPPGSPPPHGTVDRPPQGAGDESE
jgi:molecular chaperone GrpE